MKSRVVQTRFWDDEQVSEFSPHAKYLYVYLLTCQYINVSGAFQLPDKKIQFETGITDIQLEQAKSQLSEAKKVLFYYGWIYVVNSEKNNNYRKIPNNEKTYKREWERVPERVRVSFMNILGLPLPNPLVTPSQLDIIHKSNTQIINNKSQIINHKEEISPEVTEKGFTKLREIIKEVTL